MTVILFQDFFHRILITNKAAEVWEFFGGFFVFSKMNAVGLFHLHYPTKFINFDTAFNGI